MPKKNGKFTFDKNMTREQFLAQFGNSGSQVAESTSNAIAGGMRAEAILDAVRKEKSRRAAIVAAEKAKLEKKGRLSHTESQKLDIFNNSDVNEAYKYTDRYRGNRSLGERLFDSPSYKMNASSGALELFSPTPKGATLLGSGNKILLLDGIKLDAEEANVAKRIGSVTAENKLRFIPEEVSAREYAGNRESLSNAAYARKKAIQGIEDERNAIDFFADGPTALETKFRTALPDITKSIKDSDINPLFLSKTVEGIESPSLAVSEFRKYLQDQGVYTNGISDTDLAKFLTSRYNQLSSTAKGNVRNTIFWHSSGDNLDVFDFAANQGKYTGNTGAVGSGNYFSLTGTPYGIHTVGKDIWGIPIKKYRNQPYIISDVDYVVDGRKYPEYGFFTHSKMITPENRLKDIERAKRAPSNMLFYDDMEQHNQGFIQLTGDSRFLPNGFALKRNTGVKSIFPHPDALIQGEDGAWKIANTDWNSPYLHFAFGGNLYGDGGKKKEYTPSEELIQYLMSTEAFLDRPDNSLDGVWTIGFGDTDEELNNYYLKNRNLRYSRKDAEKRLRERISNEFLPQLAKTVPNWDRLTDAQKDSLLSYAYNVGKYFVSTHKNFAKAMQDFDLARAAAELNASENDRRYPGIKTRRAIEKAAFLDPSISVFGGKPVQKEEVSEQWVDWTKAPWATGGPSINMSPLAMRSADKIYGDIWNRPSELPDYDLDPYTAKTAEVPVAPVQPQSTLTQELWDNFMQPGEYNIAAKGGKIHIKSSKKGTFTAAAKKHGKSVQAFASQVLANKDNYSPAMVKKANFARNAAKWHSEGGLLDRMSFVYGDKLSALEAIRKAKEALSS